MKRKVIRLVGLVVGVVAVMAILAGCSQGYSSGGSTPSNSTPAAQAPQTTATPTATPVSAGPTSKSSTAYRPKGFTPTASGNNILLSMSAVAEGANGNFFVNNMAFMAYLLDGKYYVRANVCVPCGSRSFTLQAGLLKCNSCGTIFSSTTGKGMSGVSACMSYAKKAVAYTIEGDNMVMTLDDLTTAYQDTLNRRN